VNKEDTQKHLAKLSGRLRELQGLAETGTISDEEFTEIDTVILDVKVNEKRLGQLNQMDEIQARLSSVSSADSNTSSSLPIKPEVEARVSVGQDRAELERFPSFGQQLQAVYRSSQDGGFTDPRLRGIEQRATLGGSAGVPHEGGFLVQTDFSEALIRRVYETGQVASRTFPITISSPSNSVEIPGVDETSRADGSRWGGVRGYWTNEAAASTASTPKFRNVKLSLEKLTGLAYSTEELLGDATALDSIMSQAFGEELGFKVDDAIVNGDGAGKPLGFLNAACLVSVAKESGQAAATIVQANILKMWSRLWAPSQANAVWFINQDTQPQLFSIELGSGGSILYLPPGAMGNAEGTLLGAPVIPIEQCQTLGTKGDLYLCDMSQYALARKGGVESATSIHVQFLTGQTAFRFVLRVDGQPLWNAALTAKNGSNTVSPFISLDTRS